MATLSLVIPAYNEEARLPTLLNVLAGSADKATQRAGLDLAEALVVDDGSSDRTWRLLNEAASANSRLRPIARSGNCGKGAAVAEGVRRARGDYVLLVDVDLSTPLEELHKLTAAMREGADLAVGSRHLAGAVTERGPLLRKLTGRGFSIAVRGLTGLAVRDTQNGFKLLLTRVARRLLSRQLCNGFAFDVELLLRADLAGLRIEEIPVLYVHDPRSQVRVASASLQMLRDVVRLAYRLRPRRNFPPTSAGARTRRP